VSSGSTSTMWRAAGALLLVSALAGVLVHQQQKKVLGRQVLFSMGGRSSGLDELGVADSDDSAGVQLDADDAGRVEYTDAATLDSLAETHDRSTTDGERYATELFDKGPTKMALLEDSAHNGGRLGKLDHQLAQEQHYLDDGSDGGFYSSIHSRNKYNRRVIDGADDDRQSQHLKPLWGSDDLTHDADVGGISARDSDGMDGSDLTESDSDADDELEEPRKAAMTALAIDDDKVVDADKPASSDQINFAQQADEKNELMKRLKQAESRLRRSLDIITH